MDVSGGRRMLSSILSPVFSSTLGVSSDSSWIVSASDRPRGSWDSEAGPQVTLGARTPGLLDTIAVQLFLNVCRASDLAVCAGCRTPYVRRQKPPRGRRTYCERCRKNGVARRHASAAWSREHPDYFKEYRQHKKREQAKEGR